jgi:hypothetical protein
MERDLRTEVKTAVNNIVCKLDFLMVALEGIGEGTERPFERPEAAGLVLILEGIHADLMEIDETVEQLTQPAAAAA